MRKAVKLIRYDGNPILRPIPEHHFEAQNVSNAAAIMHDGRVHLLFGDQYLVYYGAADRVMAVATVPVSDCRL